MKSDLSIEADRNSNEAHFVQIELDEIMLTGLLALQEALPDLHETVQDSTFTLVDAVRFCIMRFLDEVDYPEDYRSCKTSGGSVH